MTEHESISSWAEQDQEARELIFRALCASFGSDLANLIIGLEASGNPRPLAGLSPDQLRSLNTQLAEMGVELRHTLAPQEQLAFDVSLNAAQKIVANEMRKKVPAAASGLVPGVAI